METEFLKSDIKFGINWFPFQENPNILSFAYILFRMSILSWLMILLFSFPMYLHFGNLNFVNDFKLYFVFCFALFEEQSRWLFSGKSENVIKSSVLFFVLITVFEFFAFYKPGISSLFDHLFGRIPSISLHAFNGFLSFLYHRKFKNLFVFILALVLHIAFNMVF